MKLEAHELAVFQTKKLRQFVGAATSGSTRIVKAFGRLASSSSSSISSKKKTTKGAPTLSLNKRLLATIKEPHIEENAHDSLVDNFHAPSVTLSINETACSAKPPTCPKRQISFCASNESRATEKIVETANNQSEQFSADAFDRFLDETIPCNKAPPSKPFQRKSIEHGYRDSMTSTISAMTLSSSLDGSFFLDEEEDFPLEF